MTVRGIRSSAASGLTKGVSHEEDSVRSCHHPVRQVHGQAARRERHAGEPGFAALITPQPPHLQAPIPSSPVVTSLLIDALRVLGLRASALLHAFRQPGQRGLAAGSETAFLTIGLTGAGVFGTPTQPRRRGGDGLPGKERTHSRSIDAIPTVQVRRLYRTAFSGHCWGPSQRRRGLDAAHLRSQASIRATIPRSHHGMHHTRGWARRRFRWSLARSSLDARRPSAVAHR